ncbi:apolipoprotein D-like [Homalodisca vitripennis]|uniref:apolipoprotein D-like n=1 Tax=Homalodisca vitripennis TaxID=197043 RepID=UPI001EEA2127|nr:apolipoprotein D-like [Homalodisca vitripennis]KAG8286510.1 hypothetical protein J6590_057595 [Homalodisca vitripennis]
MKVFVLVAACLAVATAECPNLTPVQSFNVAKYLGTWYQQASFGTFFSQGFSRCAKAEYTLDSASGKIHLKNSQKTIFGKDEAVSGTVALADPTKNEGKLDISLELPFGTVKGQLLVLATDYDNYAIVYSCRTFFGYPMKHAWILTRKQDLEGDDKTKVEALVDAALTDISSKGGPKKTDFWKTCQKNC